MHYRKELYYFVWVSVVAMYVYLVLKAYPVRDVDAQISLENDACFATLPAVVTVPKYVNIISVMSPIIFMAFLRVCVFPSAEQQQTLQPRSPIATWKRARCHEHFSQQKGLSCQFISCKNNGREFAQWCSNISTRLQH